MRQILCLSILLIFASAAFADIARPDGKSTHTPKPRRIDTTLSIKLDRDAKDARLIIPKSQLKQLRAQLDALDDDQDDTVAITSPDSFSRTQTIVSGMFLSLAVVFGGMWFVRSGKAATKGGKSMMALAVMLGIASAATFVYANAGPPMEARSITGKMFSQAMHIYGFGWGRVKLEISADSDQIELIVPNPKSAPAPTNSNMPGE